MPSIDAVLGLHPDERGRVAALCALSFVLGLALSVIELAVDTELLAGTSPKELPWANIAVGVAVILSGALLGLLRPHLSPTALTGGPLVFASAAALLAVPALIGGQGIAGLLVLYAGHRVLTAFATVAFWTVAARALDVEQSRRLYGLASAGELVAVIVVGLAAAPLYRGIDLPVLLAGALALLVLAALAMTALASRAVPSADARPLVSPADPPTPSATERRHAARIITYYCAYNVTYYLIEFTLFVSIQRAYPDRPDAIAGTLGALAIARIGVSALVRVFLAGRLLTRVGLGPCLASTPAAVLGLVGLTLTLPPLAAAAALATGESAVRNGVGKPAFMASQRPLSPVPRERVLVAIETVVEPTTTSLAGALLLLLPGGWLSGPVLLFIPAPTALLWLLAARSLARSYRRIAP